MNIPMMSTIELGLVYSLVAMGVYLTFRVIQFPDLTVDGSFTLGAAIAATLLTQDVNPVLATGLACLGGASAGAVTACLHRHLRIMGLLASILTMTALYSVNLRVMGKPNISLFNITTLFSYSISELLLITCLIVVIFFLLMYFLLSEYGLSLRAAGINPTISRSYGVNLNRITLTTLALSNGLVALAGALFAQSQGFADISLGNGTIIIGLASVMTGEALLNPSKIYVGLLACIVGSILYRFVIALALNSPSLGLQASDLNFITAALVAFALMTPRLRAALMQSLRGKQYD